MSYTSNGSLSARGGRPRGKTPAGVVKTLAGSGPSGSTDGTGTAALAAASKLRSRIVPSRRSESSALDGQVAAPLAVPLAPSARR